MIPFIKGKVDVGRAFEAVTSAADKAAFSQEERADFNKSVADAQVEYLKTTVSENSIRSITRRCISFAVMGTFLALVIMAAIVYRIDPEWARFILEICAGRLGAITFMVAVFFFGAYYAKKFIPDARVNARKK